MKKQFLLLFVLACTICMSSCEKDNDAQEEEQKSEGAFVYDNTSYPVKNGYLKDYGSVSGHLHYGIIVTDGSFSETDPDAELKNYKVSSYIELYPDGNTFKEGTYTYINENNYNTDAELIAATTNKSYMSQAGIGIDLNSDGNLVDSEMFIMTDGSVTVAKGSGNYNYTITYDLTLEGGKKVTGSFSGTFKYRLVNG